MNENAFRYHRMRQRKEPTDVPGGQPFKTERRTCKHCGEPFTARVKPGRTPDYCPGACAREAKLERDRNRGRPYRRCQRCQRNRDCRWGEGGYCSALCFGVAAMVARGIAESDAETRVSAVLARSPRLPVRKPQKRNQDPWCPKCGGEKRCASWCPVNAFTGDSAATINGLESDLPDVAVKHTDTGLGGHLGPDDGFTAPHIPRAVDQNHDWFQANPEWWVTPEPERGDVKPMIRIHGSVYPVEVLAFVATVKNAVASDYVQAA